MEQICKVCGTPKTFHPAGFRKDGTEYDEFWGCPKYKDAQHQQAKLQYQQTKIGGQKIDSSALIMDELQAFRREFNDRMDNMALWLEENIIKTIEK